MDRQRGVFGGEVEVVPLVLLADVAQRVEGPFLVRLVDGNHVGEVEHVDLLELGGCPVLGGHHIHRKVGEIDDLGVRLADTRGLQDHQVEPGRLHHVQRLADMRRQRQIRLAGRQRAHVGTGMGQRVHPDPIPE